jgi:cobalamin biosynthesis protein CobD/CbiB
MHDWLFFIGCVSNPLLWLGAVALFLSKRLSQQKAGTIAGMAGGIASLCTLAFLVSDFESMGGMLFPGFYFWLANNVLLTVIWSGVVALLLSERLSQRQAGTIVLLAGASPLPGTLAFLPRVYEKTLDRPTILLPWFYWWLASIILLTVVWSGVVALLLSKRLSQRKAGKITGLAGVFALVGILAFLTKFDERRDILLPGFYLWFASIILLTCAGLWKATTGDKGAQEGLPSKD